MSLPSLLLQKLTGAANRRNLKKLERAVAGIHLHEKEFAKRSDAGLRSITDGWRRELSAIEDASALRAALDQRAEEAFALVREAARRIPGWDLVPYDVQFMAGLALHEGMIAEVATGEGKTLAATLPIFLNALAGRGVHVATANEYLARRDAEWMGRLYAFLGLEVGCIHHGLDPDTRRAMYACDVTYGTSSEFGFDYLRDNAVAMSGDQQVQRAPFYAIVDEIDSVLIDEARTPLIITQPSDQAGPEYREMKRAVERLIRKQAAHCVRIVSRAENALREKDTEEAGRLLFLAKLGQPRHPRLLRLLENPNAARFLERTENALRMKTARDQLTALKEELHFTVEAKTLESDLTEKGREFLSPRDPDAFLVPDVVEETALIEADANLSEGVRAERLRELDARAAERAARIHTTGQLLKAYCLYEQGVHYVVADGKVVIVDENTGHLMRGRRWSDGLHQAVEAKEGVAIERETETIATITIQNYFRLYPRLAGMTGTAITDAEEFEDIYGLHVVTIPTHRPNRRSDLHDLVFRTKREKFRAVVREIARAHRKGQPVLVGTANVEASEMVSRMLRRKRIPHHVLNAKNHEREAEIIARAGERGAVTVSTNMAGRGTDIQLGKGVADLGGLLVLGCERHESRRVDRQLRGRCARQGDPGVSRFFVSFEDDLMRHFGNTEWIIRMLEKTGGEEGIELEHPLLSKSIERAQKRVEAWHFERRKETLKYDNVLSHQRAVVYQRRREIMQTPEPRKLIFDAVHDADRFARYEELVSGIDESEIVATERELLLRALDRLWRDHLHEMDTLREMVHYQAHGQKDPLLEYRRTGFELFNAFMDRSESSVLDEELPAFTRMLEARRDEEAELARLREVIPSLQATLKPERGKTGRNVLCPCGSGKKFKRCCMRL